MEEQIRSGTPCVAIGGSSSVNDFDTVFSFSDSTVSKNHFVNAVSSSIDDKKTFSFNSIPRVSGLPESMNIIVKGVESIVVDFPRDYRRRAFKYTHSNGLVFYGQFTNGIVRF
jgi:hypothetical protein